MLMGCGVCERIELTRRGENPFLVEELETGYVVLGDFQRFDGYTLLLCKRHARELHELDTDFRRLFLEEMALTAEAVYRAFQPDKLNYELLGNGDTHLHWHLIPRYAGDTPAPGPIWQLPASELYAERFRPTDQEREGKIARLREALAAVKK